MWALDVGGSTSWYRVMSLQRIWGRNTYGQMGIGPNFGQGGDQTRYPIPFDPTPIWGFVAKSIRSAWKHSHSIALKYDGTVVASGRNHRGQLGNGTTTNSMVWVSPVPGSIEGSVKQVVANGYSSAVLLTDGRIFSWGDNPGSCKLGLGPGSPNPVLAPLQVQSGGVLFDSISMGFDNMSGIDANGIAYTWGNGSYGQLASGNTSSRNVPTPIDPPPSPATKWVKVSCGKYNIFLIDDAGKLYASGLNGWSSALGVGDNIQKIFPTPVLIPGMPGTRKVVDVCPGEYQTVCLCDDGTGWAWGYNDKGQLGDGTYGNVTKYTPVQISGGPFIATRTGTGQSQHIKDYVSIIGYGANDGGQLGLGAYDSLPHYNGELALLDISFESSLSGDSYKMNVNVIEQMIYVPPGEFWTVHSTGKSSSGDNSDAIPFICESQYSLEKNFHGGTSSVLLRGIPMTLRGGKKYRVATSAGDVTVVFMRHGMS